VNHVRKGEKKQPYSTPLERQRSSQQDTPERDKAQNKLKEQVCRWRREGQRQAG
jgi:hypothetical protein